MVRCTSSTRVKAAHKAISCPCSLAAPRPCVPSNISSAVSACLRTSSRLCSRTCGVCANPSSFGQDSGLEQRWALSSGMHSLSWQQQHKLLTPDARVWCGDGEPEVQGLRVLGIPGHPAFVRSELRKKTVLHSVLFERILVQDLQSTWLLLLYCANPLEDVAQFEHDAATQSCLGSLAQVSARISPLYFFPLEVVGFEAAPGRR